ncbi:MAG: hypothetical protein PHD76_15090 [Methylacidiphilales bacterium]|nr:hypothetical protein [Candidatus Methylacidiphilales bacterium]
MKTKIGLLAACAALTLGVMNLSQAAVPVTDNLPGLPPQGAEYWKAVEKEQAAAQASAPAADSRELKADSFFFTGKPYVVELGAYSFQFRNYNPELQRWTTADPSGFPDGANNYEYTPAPNSSFDMNGLQTKWITGTYTIQEKWTEMKCFSLGWGGFSLSFPFGVSASISPGIGWEKIGSVTSDQVDGCYAQKATAPSGWHWMPGDENIIDGKTYTKDSGPSYSKSYVVGESYTEQPSYDGTIRLVPVNPHTYRDGSFSITYNWERQAEE